MAAWCIRVGLPWIGLLTLLVLQGLQGAYLAKQWDASIQAKWHPDSQTLYVRVTPLGEVADYLKVCIRQPIAHTCKGKVQLTESPPNTFRYAVTGLTTNKTFIVSVKPFDKNGAPLDMWIQYRHRVLTKAPDPTDGDRKRKAKTVSETWIVAVGVVFVLAVVAALVVIYYLWRKDLMRKICFLGCCLRGLVKRSPAIEVLQLCVTENEGLIRVVKNHAGLLSRHLSLRVLNNDDLRHAADVRQWLRSKCSAQCRVIVYVSPKLIQELHRADQGEDDDPPGDDIRHDPLARAYAQLIMQRARSGSQGGCKPVLVMTGCFQDDVRDDWFLRGLPSLRGLSRFWLSRDQVLTPPHALLGKLSGFHRSFFVSLRDWRQGNEAVPLQKAVKDLWFRMNVDLKRRDPPPPLPLPLPLPLPPPPPPPLFRYEGEEQNPLIAYQNVNNIQQNFENPRHNLELHTQNFENARHNLELHTQNFENPRHNLELHTQNFENPHQNLEFPPQNFEHPQQNCVHSVSSDYDPIPPEEGQGEDSDTSEDMRLFNERSEWS